MKHYKIYALVDPRTLEPRYVGATAKDPYLRFRWLTRFKLKGRIWGAFPLVRKWVDELKDIGLEPKQIILEDNPPDGINAEKRWIAKFRQSGIPLFNVSAGGQGTNGVKKTEDWKRRNGDIHRGTKKSEECKAKIGASKIGKPRPDLAARNRSTRCLTDDQVREIRQLLKTSTLSQGEIGSRFGTSSGMICAINKNKKYCDVL